MDELERFVPGIEGQIWYEHWHRYHFAAPFAAGRTVVDAACGEGYGSALLARTWLRIRERRTGEAAEDLREALALARLHAYRNADPWWDPEAIAEIQRFAFRDCCPASLLSQR